MFSITIPDLRALPPALAQALLAEFQRQVQGETSPPPPSLSPPPPPPPTARPVPTALSETEADAFIARLRSPTTRAVVEAILTLGSRFSGPELDQKLERDYAGAKFSVGAAGGLTKAIRQVTGDPKAEFLHWRHGIYSVAEETLAALRHVLTQ